MRKDTILETNNIDDLFKIADKRSDSSEKLAVEPYSYWRSVFNVFKKKPSAIIGAVLLILLLLGAFIIPNLNTDVWNSQSHVTGGDNLKNFAPSLEHPFGTDSIGRDLFSSLFSAVKLSLGLALVISLINAFVGIIIGAIWGYFRKIDRFMIELSNLIGNIPSLLLYMLLLSIMQQLNVPLFFRYIFTLTITGWLGMAQFIRNQVIIITDREYNLASRTLGTSGITIITHNLLPFILPVIITNIALAIPSAVGLETSLSFFNLGLGADDIAIGPMLTLGYSNWIQYPWEILFPALILGILVVSFYLIGLALSDALDPKTHR